MIVLQKPLHDAGMMISVSARQTAQDGRPTIPVQADGTNSALNGVMRSRPAQLVKPLGREQPLPLALFVVQVVPVTTTCRLVPSRPGAVITNFEEFLVREIASCCVAAAAIFKVLLLQLSFENSAPVTHVRLLHSLPERAHLAVLILTARMRLQQRIHFRLTQAVEVGLALGFEVVFVAPAVVAPRGQVLNVLGGEHGVEPQVRRGQPLDQSLHALLQIEVLRRPRPGERRHRTEQNVDQVGIHRKHDVPALAVLLRAVVDRGPPHPPPAVDNGAEQEEGNRGEPLVIIHQDAMIEKNA